MLRLDKKNNLQYYMEPMQESFASGGSSFLSSQETRQLLWNTGFYRLCHLSVPWAFNCSVSFTNMSPCSLVLL